MPAKPILIKRYGRTRLYEAARGRYLSIDDLRGWQRNHVAFVVVDSETGDDITRLLLA